MKEKYKKLDQKMAFLLMLSLKLEIKELTKIREQIKDMKTHIELTKISAYFSIFSTEEKRQEEIEIYKAELKKLLKLEFTALENLQKQCEIAKVKNSNKSRYESN